MFVSETYENLASYHDWPDGGSWLDQDNLLYALVHIYGGEVVQITEAQQEAARKG